MALVLESRVLARGMKQPKRFEAPRSQYILQVQDNQTLNPKPLNPRPRHPFYLRKPAKERPPIFEKCLLLSSIRLVPCWLVVGNLRLQVLLGLGSVGLGFRGLGFRV